MLFGGIIHFHETGHEPGLPATCIRQRLEGSIVTINTHKGFSYQSLPFGITSTPVKNH